MLRRLVTEHRLDEGTVEGGSTRCSSPAALGWSAVGVLVFVSCTVSVYKLEYQNVSVHLASDKAGTKAVEVPCTSAAAFVPTQSVVHMTNCQINASQAGVDAGFGGFSDVLGVEVSTQKFAWARLQVEHYTWSRRRGSSKQWERVESDGDLISRTIVAPRVTIGPYSLTDEEIIRKIPGDLLQLHHPAWQQQGLPAPVQQPSQGSWTFSSSTMQYGEDCNCMWAGDTRVFISAAYQSVSFVGGAQAGPSIGSWQDSSGEKVAVFEPGAVNAQDMLSNRLSNKDWQHWITRGVMGLILGCGLWCMIWPLISFFCCVRTSVTCMKATIAEWCCGPCIADLVVYEEAMRTSDPQADWRICSTYSRAAVLGWCLLALICFTGWIGARYSMVVAIAIGFLACAIEILCTCCPSTVHYSSLNGGAYSVQQNDVP